MITLRSKLEDAGYDFNKMESGMERLFRRSLAGLAKAAQAEWVRIAQDRLSSSREIYVNGLRQAESFEQRTVGGESVYEISLVGDMPNNMEFGMPSFDMKAVRPGWLGGSKAKTGKDGSKYIVIPFRHSTSSDARLGYSGKALKANLKNELKKEVKKYGLDQMVRSSSGKIVSGPVAKIPPKAPVHQYLKGLTKIQTKQKGTTPSGKQRGSSQLMTWRIMSENSAPGSWRHPGLVAQNILPTVEQWANKELSKIVDLVLGDI